MLAHQRLGNHRTKTAHWTYLHTKYRITLAWQTISVYESFSWLASARWKYLRNAASMRAPSWKNCYNHMKTMWKRWHQPISTQNGFFGMWNICLTAGSGRQWPIGGSGAMGAPSSIIEQCSMIGMPSTLVEMILPVSWARVIVDLIIRSHGISSAFKRSPVNSACCRPVSTHNQTESTWTFEEVLHSRHTYRFLWDIAADHLNRLNCIGRGGWEWYVA